MTDLNASRPCPDCDGSGHAPEYGEEGLCIRCDGSGQIGPAPGLDVLAWSSSRTSYRPRVVVKNPDGIWPNPVVEREPCLVVRVRRENG